MSYRPTPPAVHLMDHLTLPRPEVIDLSNGIRLMCLDGGTQDVNQLMLSWSGGMFDYPNQNAPRLLAQLLAEGTSSLTGAEVSERLDYCGALLAVQPDSHCVTMTVTTLNSLTPQVLPLVHDIIDDPLLPETTLEIMREKMAQNLLLSERKVMAAAQRAMQPLIAGADTPLGHVITLDEIMAVDRAQVRHVWEHTMNPAGCKAFLSGKLTGAVVDEVCRMLESLPSLRPAAQEDIVALQPQQPQTVRVEVPSAVQAAVLCTIPAPRREHPDYVPLRFAAMALGGYFGSRLMKNIREDKGYTYGIYSAVLGQKEGSYTMIGAQADPAYVEPLIEELRSELRQMASRPLSDDEMERLRRHMSLKLMQVLDTPFTIMEHYHAINTVGLPEGYFEDNERAVRDITPERIAEVSARYLDPALLRTVVAC